MLKWQQSRVLGLASGTTFLFGLVWHQRSTALRLYHPLNVRPSSCTRVGRRPNTILVVAERAAPPDHARLPVSPLTSRDREIALLLARGYSNRQLAETLVITEQTAETHVKHILGKLELRSRHQVTEWVSHTDLAR